MPYPRAPRTRLRRTLLVLLLAAVIGLGHAATAGRASAAARGIPVAHSHSLYAYGHSWTTGYGLPRGALGYPALVAKHYGMWFHGRGVDGSLVQQTEEGLLGTGSRRWRTPTNGTVIIQANLNTLRDHGASRLALATSRNALRTMVATVDAAARVPETARRFRYSSSHWVRRRLPQASQGYVAISTHRGAYVDATATGGAYLVFRGTAGRGSSIAVRDLTTGRTITHVRTGRAVHPDYDAHAGIPVLYRVPTSVAGDRLRFQKTSGASRFTFDGELLQRRALAPVVLVKEPHLANYALARTYHHGSDAAVDAFNRVVDRVAAEFPNVRVADPGRAGWDKHHDLQKDGVHPNRAGVRVLARAVERVLGR